MKKNFRFILFVLLVSCSASPETVFKRSGVSFTCPAGWKITEEEAIDLTGYYLSCEKDGFNSSGLVTIAWVKDSVHIGEMLQLYKSELQDNIIYKNANLAFEDPVDARFSTLPATAFNFSMSLFGIGHRGTVYCFHANGKTITVLKQEATEDNLQNKRGFETIESSFTVEMVQPG